uniref:Uncharacterized protein n=1 Tax=Glossina brevipalpis TaxID=37001 RepID=A0A1A9WFT7_9MUSC
MRCHGASNVAIIILVIVVAAVVSVLTDSYAKPAYLQCLAVSMLEQMRGVVVDGIVGTNNFMGFHMRSNAAVVFNGVFVVFLAFPCAISATTSITAQVELKKKKQKRKQQQKLREKT